MKAVVFHEFGPPDVMQLEEVPTPEPGPGEVLIKVHMVSVNRTLDLVVRAGLYARRPPLPHVLGVDPCGVIAAVGPGVTTRKVGDRVVCGRDRRDRPPARRRLLGVNTWGGYAEYVKVPARVTHLVPDGLDFRDRHRGGAPCADRVHPAARPRQGEARRMGAGDGRRRRARQHRASRSRNISAPR